MFPEQEVGRNPPAHPHLPFPVIVISFACFYCSVSLGNVTEGNFFIGDRKEQHSAKGDDLVVLLPFSCERSSLENKPSTVISTLL